MMVVTTLREILEIDVKTCMDRDRGVKEEGNEEGSNTPFVISKLNTMIVFILILLSSSFQQQ